MQEAIYKRCVATVAAAALAVCAYRLANRRHLAELLRWVDEHRGRGAATIAAAQVAFTIMLLPTGILAIASGALFGFRRGLLLIWAACVVGETLAFALGRHLFRAYIERISTQWPTWVALEAALKEDGWKLVLLLRCCPASPFALLNYALGSTSLPFGHFFWPSFVGIVPGIALYVWGGALAKDLSGVAGEDGVISDKAPPQARAALAAVSVVTALAVFAGLAWYTKRALARRLARVESEDAEAGRLLDPTTPKVVASGDARLVRGRTRHAPQGGSGGSPLAQQQPAQHPQLQPHDAAQQLLPGHAQPVQPSQVQPPQPGQQHRHHSPQPGLRAASHPQLASTGAGGP